MDRYGNLIDKKVIPDGSSSLNTAGAVECQGVRVVTMYVIGSAGIASGAVQLEHAHDKDYTGTWATLGAPVTAVASSVAAVVAEGTFKAVRARISTAIGGGTVGVLIVGN